MSAINNFDDDEINRGIELMLRSRRGSNEPKDKSKNINLEKSFSIFKKSFSLRIEFSIEDY